RKLHGFLSKLFETARVLLRDEHGVALGDLPTNLKDLKALGYDPRVRNEPHPALDWRQVPEFMAALREHGGVTHRALEVVALTGLREGSVAIAQWSEINLEAGVWTVPIENLKDK
ncbi:MAG: integrase, partial [Alphaproteobacteria bacterium]